MSDDKKQQLIKWHKNYSHMGVTPRELYMRQNGLCFLIVEDGEIYCTDGKEKAMTCRMLNPTFECVKCMSNFTKRCLTDGDTNDGQESGS